MIRAKWAVRDSLGEFHEQGNRFIFSNQVRAFIIDTVRPDQPDFARQTSHTAICIEWIQSKRTGVYVSVPWNGKLELEWEEDQPSANNLLGNTYGFYGQQICSGKSGSFLSSLFGYLC